jgi:hypothetical protein
MPAGPLSDGMTEASPVVLASFRRGEFGEYFCRFLRQHGIDCEYRKYRGVATAFVAYGDLAHAREFLDEYRARMKKRPYDALDAVGYLRHPEPIRPPRASVWGVAGLAMAAVGVSFLLPPGLPRDLAVIAAVCLALATPIIHALDVGARAYDDAKKRPDKPPAPRHSRR